MTLTPESYPAFAVYKSAAAEARALLRDLAEGSCSLEECLAAIARKRAAWAAFQATVLP